MTEARFGHYRLLSPLGRGGMGEVWRAVDTRKGREVAVKVLGAWLGADGDYERRFRREAALAARVTGPHIVPTHDYGEIDGRLFIEMALVDGTDLARIVRREGALAPDRAVLLLEQVAAALDTAHTAGLVHRDVKPSNVLVAPLRPDREFVYLIDFGIARAVDGTQLSLPGDVLGTPAYMAPERFAGHGEPDRRGDVYALACMLFECLTGQPPFRGDYAGLVGAHLHQPVPRPSALRPALPAAVDEVVAWGMAKNPAQRCPGAGQLLAAARAALSGRVPAAPTITATPPPPPPVLGPPGLSGATRSAWKSAATGPPDRAASREGRRRVVLAGVALLGLVGLIAALLVGSRTSGVGDTGTLAFRTDPRTVALAPDGRTAYVISGDGLDLGSGTLTVIDTSDNRITATAPLAGIPTGIAISPDGRRALVTSSTDANPDADPTGRSHSGSLLVIDTADRSVEQRISIPGSAGAVAITPDGGRAYVASFVGGQVAVVDLVAARVATSLPVRVGLGGEGVVVAPDGSRVYVAGSGPDYTSGRVHVIDARSNAVVATVDVGDERASLAVAPDGRFLYVASYERNTVSIVDTASNTVASVVPIGQNPKDVAVGPEGRFVYVANGSATTLSVIDTGAGNAVRTVTVGSGPDGVAITPDGRRAYVTNFTSSDLSIVDVSA